MEWGMAFEPTCIFCAPIETSIYPIALWPLFPSYLWLDIDVMRSAALPASVTSSSQFWSFWGPASLLFYRKCFLLLLKWNCRFLLAAFVEINIKLECLVFGEWNWLICVWCLRDDFHCFLFLPQGRTKWSSRDHWLWIRKPSADPQCSVH